MVSDSLLPQIYDPINESLEVKCLGRFMPHPLQHEDVNGILNVI
uniref:Uncharacterized protein n=1 Tax=Arundo donax TaxID=35708 RepID=A0A0A9AQ55_ARUDO